MNKKVCVCFLYLKIYGKMFVIIRKINYVFLVIYLKYCVILFVIKERNIKIVVNKRYSFENNLKCYDKN